jgi:hypothetical protein
VGADGGGDQGHQATVTAGAPGPARRPGQPAWSPQPPWIIVWNRHSPPTLTSTSA